MSADPITQLTDLYKAGDADMERLKRATERNDIARLMRRLRRWLNALQAPAMAHSPSLAAALWRMNPHPREVLRITDRRYSNRYQEVILIATATALYRLAPHLAAAKPVRGVGREKINMDEQLAEMERLLEKDKAKSLRKAAKLAIKIHGHKCKNERAATKWLTEHYSDLPRGSF